MAETQTLGDYQIIKKIGQGALGQLFLAEHRFMKKQFALKILPEDITQDRAFLQRFEQEVGLLASLNHSNIVKTHNISYANGQYFLVTDCIVDDLGETTNLAQYVMARRHELTEDEIYNILSQIAEALDYAHHLKGKGVVHRGIKLNNILVSPQKDSVHVALSDFGLSRLIGTGTFLTRTFKMVAETIGLKKTTEAHEKLTPLHTTFLQSFQFLAPEQKRVDKSDLVDFKADNYAFGVLTYWLLLGEFPEGIFPMPSHLQNGLDYDWDTLIKSCLQLDPKLRAENLVDLLQKIKNEPQPNEQHLRPVIQSAEIKRPEIDPDPASIFVIDTAVKQYVPEEKNASEIQPLLTEMVVVKGGAFWQGSNDGNRDEMPKHQIQLNSFAIDIHPVTNEQFVRFLEAMGGEKDSNHNDIIRLKDSRIKRSAGKLSIESGYVKHPVVGVTWYGAVAYAKWVGKRLPTEAEWEIAALGELDGALFPSGEDLERSQANFFSSDTTAVKSYQPNSVGLYDMAGNVYQWCHDWYGYTYYEVAAQEPDNPQGPLQGVYRVLRGGCWKSLKEDLRCSRRHRNNPGTVNSTYGFRCAADVILK
jgi:formylglycine-generating enzyme required for sulfatase activity